MTTSDGMEMERGGLGFERDREDSGAFGCGAGGGHRAATRGDRHQDGSEALRGSSETGEIT